MTDSAGARTAALNEKFDAVSLFNQVLDILPKYSGIDIEPPEGTPHKESA